MALPKRLKASDFAADPGRRAGHLLYLPEATVYSLTAEQYRQLTGEEIPFVPQAIPVQREGTIELQRQLDESEAQISALREQLAAANAEIAKLKRSGEQEQQTAIEPAPAPTPAPVTEVDHASQ